MSDTKEGAIRTVGFSRASQVCLIVVATTLLIAHVLGVEAWRVDWITLALLGIILAIPFLDLVRKVKWGDFEAEIGRHEVARVQSSLANDLPERSTEQRDYVRRLLKLVEDDPRLALARIRMDIEESLKRLHSATQGVSHDKRGVSLTRMVNQLANAEVIPQSVAGALRDVIPLANRAVHGEHVSRDAAEDLVVLGAKLVEELGFIYSEQAATAAEREVITRQQVDVYSRTRYRVRTVVPLVDEPYMNTYTLDQQGLDALLDGYGEYAEFIVELTPLDQ